MDKGGLTARRSMATAPAAAVIPDGRRSKGSGSSSSPVTTAIFLFFFVVGVGVLVSARWITTTVSAGFIFPLLPVLQSISNWLHISSYTDKYVPNIRRKICSVNFIYHFFSD